MGTVIKDAAKPAGIETIFHVEDEKLVIERKADVQPVLDEIQKIRQVTDGRSKSGELIHVARIPAIAVEQYCNMVGITFREFIIDDTHVTRLLNDNDYKHLRIWEGRA